MWFLKNIEVKKVLIQQDLKNLETFTFFYEIEQNWKKYNLKCSKLLSETRHNRLQYKEVEWGALKSPEAKKSSSFDREELVGWLWL